ncbi:hypothetical protein EJB05_14185, partial [Eragrostis curvula]
MADLIEEILLRLPPDDPACLVKASLVCKLWRHVLSDTSFSRRYRAFHKTPPLLGYICNLFHGTSQVSRFVPVSTASPVSQSGFNDYWALDCRHGRALMNSFLETSLIVWNPINGKLQHLRIPYKYTYCAAAVLCAIDCCDHRNCSGGPFHVVFVEEGSSPGQAYTHRRLDRGVRLPLLLSTITSTTNPLYFTVIYGNRILKYDLTARVLSMIESPCVSGAIVMTTAEENGGLGFVAVLDGSICMWSLHCGSDEGTASARWVHRWVMDLVTILPGGWWISSHHLIGFVEIADTILIDSGSLGIFRLDLKSRQLRKRVRVTIMKMQ